MKKIMTIFLLMAISMYGVEKSSDDRSNKDEIVVSTIPDNDPLHNFKKLKWESDWAKAFEKANKSNKRVIVFVNEDYCKWCKKMKKTTLSDSNIQKKLDNYVLFKVKRSNKEMMKHIEDFSGAIPSFYIFSPKGEQLDNIVGYFQKEDFMDYLNEIEKDN